MCVGGDLLWFLSFGLVVVCSFLELGFLSQLCRAFALA
jgi:hypothetical protein